MQLSKELLWLDRRKVLSVGLGGPLAQAHVEVVPGDDADDVMCAVLDNQQLAKAHLDEGLGRRDSQGQRGRTGHHRPRVMTTHPS